MFETNGTLKILMLAGIVMALGLMGIFQLAVWFSDRARNTSSARKPSIQRSTHGSARSHSCPPGHRAVRRLRGNRTQVRK